MKKIFTLILNKFNLRRSNLFKNPILIYTMGKVGSSMIERQLPNAYHCHTLYGNPPCPPYLIFKFGKVINFIRKLAVYPLKRIILRNRKKLKIVTLYRDPLTRNPSMMFQDLHFWIADYLLSKPNFNRESNSTMLLDIFKDTFPHNYPETWVRDELSRFTKVPERELYLGQQNYKIITKNNLTLFVGKVEALGEYIEVLEQFVDNELKLTPANVGKNKWYASIYDELKSPLIEISLTRVSNKFRELNGYK